MLFFHRNKSRPELPSSIEAASTNDNTNNNQTDNTTHHSRSNSQQDSLGPQPSPPHQPGYDPATGSHEPPSHHHTHSQTGQLPHEDRYAHPAHAIARSGSQRRSNPQSRSARPHSVQFQPGKATLNLVPAEPSAADTDNSDTLSPVLSPNQHSVNVSPQAEPQPPRKSRRSIFGLQSKDKFKDKDKDSSSKVLLSRNTSVSKKGAPQTSRLRKFQKDPQFEPTQEHENGEVVDHRMPQHSIKTVPPTLYPSRGAARSSSQLDSQSFDPTPVQRVSTEPLSQREGNYQERTPHYNQHQQGLHQPAHQNPQFQIDNPQGHSGRTDYATDQSLHPVSAPHPSQSGMAQEKPTGKRQPVDQQQHGYAQPPQGSGQQQYPSTPGMPQGQSFKGNTSQSSVGEREQDASPPQAKAKDEPPDVDVRALLQRHEELQHKYNKVKKYYFEKEAQVQQLQNTVAHQRMATSRTALDDNEYATRFGRLDGAINNLSFNIRKDWKCIPPWLQGFVNDDAHNVGTKEMTAAGRACLTRWIVDEVFDRYFHPALEPNLSRQLKQIERNVRRQGKIVTEEDKENHLSKLSSWRRTTLDGLGDILQSKLADDHLAHLTKNLVEKLTASLEMNLQVPPPPGLENSVAMIMELAIGIAANIPLESRDITVEYFLPGTPIAESHMKIETALPPLVTPGPDARFVSEPSSAATDRTEQSSMKGIDPMKPIEGSGMEDGRDNSKDMSSSTGNLGYNGNQPVKEPRKKSVFGALMGKKPHANQAPAAGNSAHMTPSRPDSATSRDQRDDGEHREKENDHRIRFAAFVSVEVRGNVLTKAPVYSFT